MRHSALGLKFLIAIDVKIFKTLFVESFKKILKIPISDLNRDFYFKFRFIFREPSI